MVLALNTGGDLLEWSFWKAIGLYLKAADGYELWRKAIQSMNEHSKDEGLFHELHVLLGLQTEAF